MTGFTSATTTAIISRYFAQKRQNGVLAGYMYEVEKTQIRCATLAFCAACCPRVWHNVCKQKNMVGFTFATTTAIISRYFVPGIGHCHAHAHAKKFRNAPLLTFCIPMGTSRPVLSSSQHAGSISAAPDSQFL